MKVIRKLYYHKGGQGGGYTIRLAIPKEMLDKIGVDKEQPYCAVEYDEKNNQIIITKGQPPK